MPTFELRLSTFRKIIAILIILKFSEYDNFHRQIFDYDFLLKNPDYKHLICRIDASEQFNWLDFNMSGEDQIKLFNLGTEAVEFLNTFDWKAYKRFGRTQIRQMTETTIAIMIGTLAGGWVSYLTQRARLKMNL